MSEGGIQQGVEPPHEQAQPLTPLQRISIPEYVDHHMIFDYELDHLSQFETGVLGSIGFVALGAALGCIAPVSGIVSKLQVAHPSPLTTPDMVQVVVFIGSAVAALICLGLFAINKTRNAGLAKKIRSRKKHNLPTSAASV